MENNFVADFSSVNPIPLTPFESKKREQQTFLTFQQKAEEVKRKDSERRKLKRTAESPETKQKRWAAACEKRCKQRAAESPETKQKRRETAREERRKQRAAESPETKQIKRDIARQTRRKQRANHTPEQKIRERN